MEQTDLTTVYTIDQLREIIVPIIRRRGYRWARLFGSYARGEADSQSDLDFLYDNINHSGMFAYFGFVYDLEDELGCHVDVVTTGISDKEFLTEIKQDEVLLYAEEKA